MKRQKRLLRPLLVALFPPLLLLTGCFGDIGSSSEDSTNVTTNAQDNSTQNGISTCQVSCTPMEGGWAIVRECEGMIQDGPVFASSLGSEGCAWPPEEEDGEEDPASGS